MYRLQNRQNNVSCRPSHLADYAKLQQQSSKSYFVNTSWNLDSKNTTVNVRHIPYLKKERTCKTSDYFSRCLVNGYFDASVNYQMSKIILNSRSLQLKISTRNFSASCYNKGNRLDSSFKSSADKVISRKFNRLNVKVVVFLLSH